MPVKDVGTYHMFGETPGVLSRTGRPGSEPKGNQAKGRGEPKGNGTTRSHSTGSHKEPDISKGRYVREFLVNLKEKLEVVCSPFVGAGISLRFPRKPQHYQTISQGKAETSSTNPPLLFSPRTMREPSLRHARRPIRVLLRALTLLYTY